MIKLFLHTVIYFAIMGLITINSVITHEQNNKILAKIATCHCTEKEVVIAKEEYQEKFKINSYEVVGGELLCVEDESLKLSEGQVIIGTRVNGDVKYASIW